MRKGDFYFWTGVFFVLLQVVAIVRNFYLDFVYFFWFCDFIPVVLALGFFLKNNQFIKGIVNIGFFPQVIYFFSFIVRLFFGVSFLEGMDELFGYNFFIIVSSLLLHLAVVIAFGFVYRVRIEKKSLIYSGVFLCLMYLVGVVFTEPVDSINYVFFFSNLFGLDYLSLFWVPAAFALVVLPTYWFQSLVYQYFKK